MMEYTTISSVSVSQEQLQGLSEDIHRALAALSQDGYRPERIEIDRRFESVLRFLPGVAAYGFGAWLNGVEIERHADPVLRVVGKTPTGYYRVIVLQPFIDERAHSSSTGSSASREHRSSTDVSEEGRGDDRDQSARSV